MKRFYLLLIWVVAMHLKLSAQQVQTKDTTDAYIESIYRELPEVMITGERPVVKASQGKLIYDVPRLIQNRPVDNAYDAIKELPGVAEMNGVITLAGQGVTVVIDGKVSTMSTEQLNTLLKTIPAGRIEKAEVMYSASARYQARGPMINICLKSDTSGTPSLQGELYTAYRQEHEEGLTERASLLYSKSKFSADFLYSYNYDRSYSLVDKEALHTLADGSVHPLTMHEVHSGRSNKHSLRLGTDYNFSKDHQLSLVYNGSFSNGHYKTAVNGTQISSVQSQSTDQLHNGRMDYHTPFGLKAGAEYTYYISPSSQLLHSALAETQLDFLSKDQQLINKWYFFLSQEHQLKSGWNLNYGINYTTATDNSFQYYYDTENGDLLPDNSNVKSLLREQTLNIYAGFSKSFGDKVSLDFSLAGEQYHTSLWDEWTLYPALNLNYAPSAGNSWQLSFTSDKSYPDYWSIQNSVSYSGGGYSEIRGNPFLKPDVEYQANLTYILKSKYMLSAFFSHTKNKMMQTPYQSPDRLVEIFSFQNFNFSQQAGIMAVIPFKVKNWLNSRFTAIGFHYRQKDSDFWDIPFDRKLYTFVLTMSNTFTLSAKPDLKLVVSGFYQNRAIQSIYDLPRSGNIDAALRYTFARERAVLTLRCDDIFETGGISPQIRLGKQYATDHFSKFREFGISFSYKFGGYKEKDHAAVDTSRFK